jgi:type II secretory pathway predicted ATPase ExeA
MYYKYFGLRQAPFKITPDPRLFFTGGNRGATLDAVIYAITSGEGIVKVVGEVGSGKTMLCRMLEVELPRNVEIVYLANPRLAPEHVLHAIALELKLPVENGDDRLKVLQVLQDFLLRKHADNRRVVVFVEEAQGMPVATLEEIRLLTNLETSQDKLLQIVLFGQPELDETLRLHEIRQLRERITYHFYLEPFTAEEIRAYINTRLLASGYRAGEPFTTGAIRAIARHSLGLLRRINILADKAMLAAYAENATRIDRQHVLTAANDSEFHIESSGRWWPWAMAAGLMVVLGAALYGWLTDTPLKFPEPPAAMRNAPGNISGGLGTTAPDGTNSTPSKYLAGPSGTPSAN